MKKLLVPSLAVVTVAAISGVAIGLSMNRPVDNPVRLIDKTASVTQDAPTSTPSQTTSAPKEQANQIQTAAPDQTTPDPVTVTAYKQVPLETDGDIDCILTYSDGTTYQWHWQTFVPQYQWVVSRNGVGAWESTTQTLNSCDDSVIGTPKQ